MTYQYNNTKSRLHGQLYEYRITDGTIYLKPIGGKAKAQRRMTWDNWLIAVKAGHYGRIKSIKQ